VGVGSLLYAWLKLGQLLEEPALLEEAHALASLLEPERITKDREYDVGHGSAGALLCLLVLGAAVDQPGREGVTPSSRALLAAEHLLRQRTSHKGGPLAWTSASAAAPRSGMAHGTAGICLALARQWRRDRGPRWLEAISEGLRLERELYDGASGNWRNSVEGKPQLLMGWCYGAPGIALSRVGMLEAGLEGPVAAVAREDLTQALKTMLAAGNYPLDHLCCGSMARAEALLRAWQFTGEGPLLQAAHAVALRVLRAAKTRGGFQLGTGDGTEPSLFQGLAGVGYSLLRLAEPAVLPCVLLFE
jgi:lantibiotic modifying enzyme